MSDLQRSHTKITLEDILRIKRAERPPPEFWAKFEQTLREKQLAAIVRKQPWWRSWTGLARVSLPLSAAAAVAITLVAAGRSPKKVATPIVMDLAAPAMVVHAGAEVMLPSVDVDVAKAVASSAVPVIARSMPAKVEEASVIPTSAAPSGRLASVTEQVAGIGVDLEESESDRSPQFASVAQREAGVAEGFTVLWEHAVAHLDAAGNVEKTSSVEPLSQLPTPRDARRARLLAFTSSVDTHSPQYSDNSHVIRSRERITSHLNEEAIYDSIRRLGLQGNRVSIQF